MKVLFICKSNIGRSQIAEAFFNKLSKKNKSTSAGVEAADKGKTLGEKGRIIVDCMIEEGLDLYENKIKPLTLKEVKQADLVIIIGDETNIPDYVINSKKRLVLWPIADAKGKNLQFHKQIRDEIKKRVENLIFQLENENLAKKI